MIFLNEFSLRLSKP